MLSPTVSCENPLIQCVLFGLRWHAVDGCDLHGGLDPWLALIFDLVPICCACHRLQGAFHALMEQLKGRGPCKCLSLTNHRLNREVSFLYVNDRHWDYMQKVMQSFKTYGRLGKNNKHLQSANSKVILPVNEYISTLLKWNI